MSDTINRAEIGVIVNGETVTTRASTVAELLMEAGYAGAKVATAVNGAFVAEARRAEMGLSAGDHIEIVAPRQGG